MTPHEPHSVSTQYANLHTKKGLVIYDRECPTAWIHSSTALDLAAMT